MWTKKQKPSSRNSTKSGVKTKKSLYLEICADFHEFRGETTKKRIFITKSAKKQFLLTNSGVITRILGVSGIELHSRGTEPVTFFGAQSLLGRGAQFSFGGPQAVIWGAQPRNAPVASGLLQVYSNLSNCNYCVFVNEILLENEERRTFSGNKEVPQTFFHNFLYL